ncbi:MAG: ATP-grasp domain-containing protein [Candidatus Gastranaerophilales bacterium]|nr:ATP-grasp domain-containing protein [Candidatus Gastranaerophilales bacterium]
MPKINNIAEKINSLLKLQGVWFFQLKENKNGELCLLEIAPRVAGTMGLSRAYGVNLPLLSLFDALGEEISIVKNNYSVEIDRALENRFYIDLDYDVVYVDFDDCLVIKGKVNTSLIAFLYQSINKNKKIILISKHDGSLENELKKYKLKNIFDEIIHLQKNDKKYNYITMKRAIFIDDSFAERKEISEKKSIPVFSPDIIENLEI